MCSGGSFCKNSHKIIWLDIVSEYNWWTQDIVFGRFLLPSQKLFIFPPYFLIKLSYDSGLHPQAQ